MSIATEYAVVAKRQRTARRMNESIFDPGKDDWSGSGFWARAVVYSVYKHNTRRTCEGTEDEDSRSGQFRFGYLDMTLYKEDREKGESRKYSTRPEIFEKRRKTQDRGQETGRS